MLRWSISFFVVAIIAAVFGFSGIAASAEWVARVLFTVFLVLAIVSLFTGKRSVNL